MRDGEDDEVGPQEQARESRRGQRGRMWGREVGVWMVGGEGGGRRRRMKNDG
jgi:hypothetical protein